MKLFDFIKIAMTALGIFSVASTVNAEYVNPIVNRLPQREIEACKTPAAIAYNYVNAIVNSDYKTMQDLQVLRLTYDMREYMSDRNMSVNKMLNEMFGPGNPKLDMMSWKPALGQGWEIAVLYVQNENVYLTEDGNEMGFMDPVYRDASGTYYIETEEGREYYPEIIREIRGYKVYVGCVPSQEIGRSGFQDITRFNRQNNVKVLIREEYDFPGHFVVTGFK